MRTLSLALWLSATFALLGGWFAVATDVPVWPYVKAAAVLGAAALAFDLVLYLARKLVGR